MKTSTFTVNNVGDPEPVIATIDCREITIGEDPSVADWPTTDYEVKGTVQDSSFVRRPAGTTFQFLKANGLASFGKGQIVGYVQTVTGSTTFQMREQ